MQFDPEGNGWYEIFNRLDRLLENVGMKPKMGGCFHCNSRIPEFLQNPLFELAEPFRKARDDYSKQQPFEFGLHATFGNEDLPLSGNYIKVLEKDVALAEYIGATCIVAHPPRSRDDRIIDLIELLTSNVIIGILSRTNVELHWENMGYGNFFGSLKHLVNFRQGLKDKLQEIGRRDLLKKHLFCLDTGHLLLWRDNEKDIKDANKEIDEFLPKFGAKTRSFHIHANDGHSDNHIVPFSLEFFNHLSRAHIQKDKFLQNSEDVMGFLKTCEQSKTLENRHLHVEALRLPFSLDQMEIIARKLMAQLEI